MMVIYLLCLIYTFFCTNYVFEVNNLYRNGLFSLIFLALLFIMIIKNKKNKYLNNKKYQVIFKENKMFLALYFSLMIYSIIIHIIRNDYSLVMPTIVTSIMVIIAISLALVSTILFDKKNIKIITLSSIITYSIILITFIIKNGFAGLVHFRYLNETFIDNGLEAHELMFILGLLFLFFSLSKSDNNKCNRIIFLLVLGVYSFLGVKRIIVLSLILCLFLKLMKLFFKNICIYNNFLKVTGIIVILCYLLLFTTFLPQTKTILELYNINTMGRIKLYSYINKIIQISPTYIGYGLRYTEKYLGYDIKMKYYGAIHNDIIRLYVENGIYFFIIILWCYFFKFTKIAEEVKKGSNISKSILIILFFFIGCFTDNLTTYYRFIFVMFAIIDYLMIIETNNVKKIKNEKLISIIVPVYNVQSYLRECCDSLVKQTYNNIEIIFVDDGSTDNSGKMCDKFKNEDPRIITLHKKNGGLSDARNYGVKYAKGTYITFVDSDDVISTRMIEILYLTLIENEADISIIDPVHFYDNDNAVYTYSNSVKLYDSEDAICTMLYQQKFLVSAWGKLYKKELVVNNIFPKGMIFEDIAVMYKIFDECNRIAYNNSKLYGYRHRTNSITTKSFSKKDLDILKICEEMNSYFAKSTRKINRAVSAYIINANLRVYLNSYEYKDFFKENKKCKNYIDANLLRNIINHHIRFKLRCALLLFLCNKKIMFNIYSKINRWK